MKKPSSRPTRILIPLINYGYLKGGGEYYAHQIGERLRHDGASVTYLCGKDPWIKPEVLGDASHVHFVPYSYGVRRLGEKGTGRSHQVLRIASYVLYRASAKRYLRRHASDYDLINTQDIISTIAALDARANDLSAKIVATVHGMPTAWEMRYLRKVDLVIAVNTSIAAFIKQHGMDEVRVIEPGADERVFVPGDQKAARAKVAITGKAILFVGRLIPVKNLETLIRCLRSLPDVHLHIVGTGVLADDLLTLADTEGVAPQLNFYGQMSSPQELLTFYQAADLLVVPSFVESFSMVALEAMFAGCPVVASTTAEVTRAFPELIPTFNPTSEKDMTACLKKALQNTASLRKALSAATKQLHAFSWNSRLRETKKAFDYVR